MEKKRQEKAKYDERAVGWYLRLILTQQMEQGLSQAEIARRSGVPSPTVNYIVNNGDHAGYVTAAAMADYLHMTPGQLWDTAIDWWRKIGHKRAAYEDRIEAELKATIASGEYPSQPKLPALELPPTESASATRKKKQGE